MSSWTQHVMWWQVYPLGFTGAPVRPSAPGGGDLHSGGVVHRLQQVENWLDHLVGLGLNGLALGPVFAAETHGYDTTDQFAIDPRLGTDDDLDHLVASARCRGVRVLLDGVFNHVGRGHPAFQELVAHGPRAGTAEMFRVDWSSWRPGDDVPTHVFEGHHGLVSLNHDSDQVVDLVTRTMTHWLGRGIDGWRLDAAYAVPPAFWTRVLPAVRREFPDAWFTGEVIHGDAAAIVEASGMDSLTQYELWQGIWHSLADGNFYELAHALERHNELLATFVPSTFVGNHDVTRIATSVGVDHVPHALAVLFLAAGVPTVYSGDEFAYAASKEERVGGDDAVRPAFPSTPPAVGELEPRAAHVLRVHQDLAAVRRRHPWLHRAHTDVVVLANRTIVLRAGTHESSIVVALSTSEAPETLPASDAERLLAGNGSLVGDHVELPAHGWSVMEGGRAG